LKGLVWLLKALPLIVDATELMFSEALFRHRQIATCQKGSMQFFDQSDVRLRDNHLKGTSHRVTERDLLKAVKAN
jgi:hypothetical protein